MQTSTRLFALSLIPQIDYDTPLAPSTAPKNYEKVIKDGYDFAEQTVTRIDNAGQSTGTPNPTESEIGNHDNTFTLVERMTSEKLGRRGTAAFGLPTSTPVAGSTGAHKHVFKPLNPQLEANLPAYTYVEKWGEPADVDDVTDDRMLPSAVMESLALSSGGEEAYLTGTSVFRGSGKVIKPSGVTFGTGSDHVVLEDQASEHSIKSGQAIMRIYPNADLGGTPIEVKCDFRNVRMEYGTAIDTGAGYLGCAKFFDQNNPDSGNVRGNMPSGNPTIALSFTLIKSRSFSQAFNPLDKLTKQTKFSISFDYTGAQIGATASNHRALFKYLKLTLDTVRQGDENGRGTYEITTAPLSLGQQYPLELEIINTIPSYATLS